MAKMLVLNMSNGLDWYRDAYGDYTTLRDGLNELECMSLLALNIMKLNFDFPNDGEA